MKVIPSIDLLGGKVVRLYQGDYEKVKVYYDDAIEALKMIISKGASRIHIVDLDGARKGSESFSKNVNDEVIKRLVQTFKGKIQFQVGGGIRRLSDVKRLIELGIDKVIIGSLIFTDYEAYQKIVKQFGEKIILALDVKEGVIKRNGWLIDTHMTINELLQSGKIGEVYAIMTTDIAVDGALTGPNFEMMEVLNEQSYKWIASGGVSSRADLEALSKLGIYGAILGKAVFEGIVEDLSDL